MNPAYYSIQCDLCGGSNIEWSEWEKMIWCYDCEVDTPGTQGIFGGPIPVQLSQAIGMNFYRVGIENEAVLRDG